MCSASMWRRFCRMNALSRSGTLLYLVNLRTPARILDASNLHATSYTHVFNWHATVEFQFPTCASRSQTQMLKDMMCCLDLSYVDCCTPNRL